MTKGAVKCSCGAQATIRHASVVHGKNARDEYLYVCSRYPICDSYVGVHRGSRKPLGTLAGKELRTMRIEAHRTFDRLWQLGIMEKRQAYKWMQVMLGLSEDQAHIAKFSEYMCKQVITLCDRVLENNRAMRAA